MRRPIRSSSESPRGARPRPGSRPDLGKGKGKRGPASGSKEVSPRERRSEERPHFDGRKKRPEGGGARSERPQEARFSTTGDSRPEKRGRRNYDPAGRDERDAKPFGAKRAEGPKSFGGPKRFEGAKSFGGPKRFEGAKSFGGPKRFEGKPVAGPKRAEKRFDQGGKPEGEKRGAPKPSAKKARASSASSDLSWLEGGPGPSKHGAPRATKRGGGRVGKRSDKHDARAGERMPAASRPTAGRPATGRSGPRPAGARPDTGTTSPRVPLRFGKPLVGPWLWLMRAGAESDLLSELRIGLGEGAGATEIAPGLVRSELAQTFEDGSIDATFARHGLRLRATVPLDADRVMAEVLKLTKAGPIAFDVIIPDSDEGNRLAARAIALSDEVKKRLLATEGVVLVPRSDAREHDARVVDVVLSSYTEALVGEIEASLALTLHPQGRARMKVASDRPSRAARKVEEALDWMGLGPGAGETCVDLGAAPGGWSWSLLERRARVIAVDPAELRPDVANHPKLTHIKASAFQYGPDEPVDWLFCDMAWRPREAAQMLAKWARKGWARILVANLKLPMKSKAEMTRELREIVHGGGWKRVRSRQLYHDRDEITLIAFT